jgi:hypothetical protein
VGYVCARPGLWLWVWGLGGVGGGFIFLGDKVRGSNELGLSTSSFSSLSSFSSARATLSSGRDGWRLDRLEFEFDVGLNDNGGNRLGLGEGIIGLGEGVFLPGLPLPLPFRTALDFFLPKDNKCRRGLSSSEGRLKSGG